VDPLLDWLEVKEAYDKFAEKLLRSEECLSIADEVNWIAELWIEKMLPYQDYMMEYFRTKLMNLALKERKAIKYWDIYPRIMGFVRG